MIVIPVIFSSLIDFFFRNFISHCLILLDFHFIFGAYFFIMLLKPGLGVDPHDLPSHGLGRVIRVTRVNRVFYFAGSKMTLF